jgi:hypothetical protein
LISKKLPESIASGLSERIVGCHYSIKTLALESPQEAVKVIGGQFAVTNCCGKIKRF